MLTEQRKEELLELAKCVGPLSVEITQNDVQQVAAFGLAGEDAAFVLRTLLTERLRTQEQVLRMASKISK